MSQESSSIGTDKQILRCAQDDSAARRAARRAPGRAARCHPEGAKRPKDLLLALASAAALLAPALAGAQSSPQAGADAGKAKIAVRQLGSPVATSTEAIGSVAAVRQLPDGGVLVNDQARRRVIMLDADMKLVGTVADSTSSTANAYGTRPGGLMAYKGDSTLFVDPTSLSMLVIDPQGKINRVMAAPRPQDVNFLIGGPFGNPGFDSQGRILYRAFNVGGMRGMAPPQPGQPFTPPVLPDTAPIVRFDLAARKLDTAGFFKVYSPSVSVTREEDGGMRIQTRTNPLPLVDDWAVLSDGTLAIVRGREYRVETIAADGTRKLHEKIPYDWQRLTDEDKAAFIDSTKAAMERARAAGPGAAAAANPLGAGGAGGGGAFGAAMGGGGGQMVIRMDGPGGGGGQRGGDGPRPNIQINGGGPGGGSPPPINLVAPSDLPDYKPVFGLGSVRADADGRLWIRTIPTKPTPGGAIYDVIDRNGKLVDRVQVPVNTAIAGFGSGGVVYLGARDGAGVKLMRVKI